MENLALYRPPHPVEAETKYFLVHLEGNAADGSDPLRARLHGLGRRLCPPHDVHHMHSTGRHVEMDVEALLGPGRGALYLGYRDGGAVCCQDGFASRQFIELAEYLSFQLQVLGHSLDDEVRIRHSLLEIPTQPYLLCRRPPALQRDGGFPARGAYVLHHILEHPVERTVIQVVS